MYAFEIKKKKKKKKETEWFFISNSSVKYFDLK